MQWRLSRATHEPKTTSVSIATLQMSNTRRCAQPDSRRRTSEWAELIKGAVPGNINVTKASRNTAQRATRRE